MRIRFSVELRVGEPGDLDQIVQPQVAVLPDRLDFRRRGWSPLTGSAIGSHEE